MAAISAGIVANYGADSSFDAQEFSVVFSGDTLQITNKEGRSLAVENVSSSDGNMTVTPINELVYWCNSHISVRTTYVFNSKRSSLFVRNL